MKLILFLNIRNMFLNAKQGEFQECKRILLVKIFILYLLRFDPCSISHSSSCPPLFFLFYRLHILILLIHFPYWQYAAPAPPPPLYFLFLYFLHIRSFLHRWDLKYCMILSKYIPAAAEIIWDMEKELTLAQDGIVFVHRNLWIYRVVCNNLCLARNLARF